ncbi:5'-3' exonuclease PLD3-like isoform X2 [Pristis pectinata]|uniref:5'-3' exonuclease PLD3-like isoform X2 n=1 Tax=Pristis pectinata TaxID=685728 RepID=UPI00223D9365|nr:5'-3' exonuclease PLD3-like isoform X2 [Pristis pectinata]
MDITSERRQLGGPGDGHHIGEQDGKIQGQVSNLEPVDAEKEMEEITEPEAEEKQVAHSRESLIPTRRNPIRGSSRIPRSSRTTWVKEEDEEEPPISVKPVAVMLEKMKVALPAEEEDEEEEEEEEAEAEEVDLPSSIAPPPVPEPDLRPTILGLQKLRERIPEEPVRRISWSKVPDFSATQPRPQGGRGWKGTSCGVGVCYLPLALLLLALGGWFLLGPGTYPGPWVPVKELKVDWIYSLFPGQQEACQDRCSLTLVESIPVGLTYPKGAPRHQSIYAAWMELLGQANKSVHIAAFYFSLRARGQEEGEPSTAEGHQVLQKLGGLTSRGIGLKIAVNSPQASVEDTDYLAEKGAEVRGVPLKNFTGGVVHTKLWVVDGKHVYLGSANMDWRSLTQVKELGVVLSNCSCLAQDMERIFGVYWHLGAEGAAIPRHWPHSYSALSSRQHPLRLTLNGIDARVYLSSAPPSLCASDRTTDLDAILDVIDDAREFVFISVMDFLPLCKFCNPQRFWPTIEDRLRGAACERKVTVRLLISCWPHTYPPMLVFLESLNILSEEPLKCSIEVKIFRVSATAEQKKIPFSRVNHNKYMVTDRIAYIGTSNWSEDYFIRTAGVGLVINQTGTDAENPDTVQNQLKAVFQRDWNSEHALELGSEGVERCLQSDGSVEPDGKGGTVTRHLGELAGLQIALDVDNA